MPLSHPGHVVRISGFEKCVDISRAPGGFFFGHLCALSLMIFLLDAIHVPSLFVVAVYLGMYQGHQGTSTDCWVGPGFLCHHVAGSDPESSL